MVEILNPGQIVGGYEILERVDRGARREVYKARAAKVRGMRDDGYRYAVKIYTNYPEDASDFIGEVEAAKRFDNFGHLEKLWDYGEHQGRPFIVSEFIDGYPIVRKEFDQRGRCTARKFSRSLSFDEILTIVEKIAEGLEYLHSRGYVARDLSLSNVMINDDLSVVKIADLGSMKRIGEEIRPSIVPGEKQPRWWPKGYINRDTIRNGMAFANPKFDAYSLGACILYMLRGEEGGLEDKRIKNGDRWDVIVESLINSIDFERFLVEKGHQARFEVTDVLLASLFDFDHHGFSSLKTLPKIRNFIGYVKKKCLQNKYVVLSIKTQDARYLAYGHVFSYDRDFVFDSLILFSTADVDLDPKLFRHAKFRQHLARVNRRAFYLSRISEQHIVGKVRSVQALLDDIETGSSRSDDRPKELVDESIDLSPYMPYTYSGGFFVVDEEKIEDVVEFRFSDDVKIYTGEKPKIQELDKPTLDELISFITPPDDIEKFKGKFIKKENRAIYRFVQYTDKSEWHGINDVLKSSVPRCQI